MKDSGIPWVGDIPSHWYFYRIKYNTFLKGRIGWQGLNSNDFIDEGYCLITGTDFDNRGGINWNTCYRISRERFDEDELLHVKEGDLLMTKDGTVGKMAYIRNLPEEASLNSHLLIIRQLTPLISNHFLYWMMLSDVFKGFTSNYQKGTIMSSISQSTLGEFSCFCPPKKEQQAIADFLDNKCSEIDELIALQEKIIEELKAYKQSVITEAVTKGLNPDVPMKDSGIEWIGKVPEHWNKDKIIRIFGVIGSGTTPKSTDDTNYEGNINWIQSGDINGSYLSNCKNKISDETLNSFSALKVYNAPFIIIAMYGASVGNASISLIDGCVNQACCVLKETELNISYLFAVTNAFKGYLIYKAVGGGQPNISQDTIKSTWIPIPPIKEQNEIANHIENKCADIDNLIAIKQSKIEELKEYKKSIIYEYVTGKKEVV